MTEYIIIVALVAIALITIISLFGNKIKLLFAGSVKALEEGKVEDPKELGQTDATKKLGKDATVGTQESKAHSLKKLKSQ